MIVHRVGQDTRIDYDWTDDAGAAITVGAATFAVYNAADEEVTMTAPAINGDYPVSIHIADDHAILPGNYVYVVAASDDSTGDISILSGGLLRVK